MAGSTLFQQKKTEYGDLEVPQIRLLESLADGSNRLKRLVAKQASDVQILTVALSEKF